MGSEALICKCCGGALKTGTSICECEYCGALNIITGDYGRYINQLNRANKLRQDKEFDRALMVYDAILAENQPTADVLWSMVLCEYGIEYVPESDGSKYIPTLHRMKEESILNNTSYLGALEIADESQKAAIQSEAELISQIQNEYLSIVSKEKSYDVFICYKEIDDVTKQQTEDSGLALDLYERLVNYGFKVFFARVTLQDKIGVNYEPYIFGALKSSKVMVVIGTKPEYFSAVWVKNEWSRFLKFKETDKNKEMFFACDDVEDLPKAFSGRQAQLLNQPNAIQNLAFTVKRCLGQLGETVSISTDSRHSKQGAEKAKLAAVVCALRQGTAKARVEYLERIMAVFDTSQSSQIQTLQSAYTELDAKYKQLIDQRSRLGMFAVAKKWEINDQLDDIKEKKDSLTARINSHKKLYGNYSSAADVVQALNAARKELSDIEMQSEIARANYDTNYCLEEALKIYLSSPEMTRAVNTALYPTIFRDSIAFGIYDQEKNGLQEPIEWLVLAREEGRILVISRYALAFQKYNVQKARATWETCSLRRWLNETFIDTVFSETEREMIPLVNVNADKNPKHSTNPGNSTMDRIFLLSIMEANKYFNSDEARMCALTDYDIAERSKSAESYGTDDTENCLWWLRTPGEDDENYEAAIVGSDGSIFESGECVYQFDLAVRPAMWIDFSNNLSV